MHTFCESSLCFMKMIFLFGLPSIDYATRHGMGESSWLAFSLSPAFDCVDVHAFDLMCEVMKRKAWINVFILKQLLACTSLQLWLVFADILLLNASSFLKKKTVQLKRIRLSINSSTVSWELPKAGQQLRHSYFIDR